MENEKIQFIDLTPDPTIERMEKLMTHANQELFKVLGIPKDRFGDNPQSNEITKSLYERAEVLYMEAKAKRGIWPF